MTTLICATLQLVAVKDQKKAYYTKKITYTARNRREKLNVETRLEKVKNTRTHIHK